MESLLIDDECCGRVRVRGISLTPAMNSVASGAESRRGGGCRRRSFSFSSSSYALQRRAELVRSGGSGSGSFGGSPYPATVVLCFACLLFCSLTTSASASSAVDTAERWSSSSSSSGLDTSSEHPTSSTLVTQQHTSTSAEGVLLLKTLIQSIAKIRMAAALKPTDANRLGQPAPVGITQGSRTIVRSSAAGGHGGPFMDSTGLLRDKFPRNFPSSNYSKDTLSQIIHAKLRELEIIRSGSSLSTARPSSSDEQDTTEVIGGDLGGGGNGDGGAGGANANNVCPPYNDLYMKENDECNAWKAFIFEYLFPFVLFLAILGNGLTLVVYRSRYLKSAATVLLLAVKAQANLAFACCLTMEMLHFFLAPESPFQDVYWRSRPYTLFLANYFDSLAMWCTLAITLETYICVSFPMSFRRWSRRRTIYVVIVCLMIASGLLHVAYPITREIERFPACPAAHRYQMVIRDGRFYYDYERVYFFLHALAVISLPVLLMAVFSVLIGYHFNRKPMGQRFSERRRCVLRITFATTLCTLVLQTPGLVVFAAAAIRGSTLEKNFSFCTVNVVTTFLTIINAAAPFLVYLCLNETFRRLLFVQLGSRFVPCPAVVRLCRRCYDFESRVRNVGNVGEITDAADSHHGALSPVSNPKPRYRRPSIGGGGVGGTDGGLSSRDRTNDSMPEADTLTNYTRVTTANYYKYKDQRTTTAGGDDEEMSLKQQHSVALLKEDTTERPAVVSVIRIVVEDVV